MKLTILAVGRMKAGAERELYERYARRADAAGRKLGLTLDIREFTEARDADATRRKDREAELMLAALAPDAILIALDEGGKPVTSPAFAERLGTWRDDGRPEVALAIGGPDGHGAALLDRADLKLAFGAMTWPHQLVRVMLAEQLYRAVAILSGHPYHRA